MCRSSLSVPPQHELLVYCTIFLKKLKVNVFFLILVIVIFMYIWGPKGFIYEVFMHALLIDLTLKICSVRTA